MPLDPQVLTVVLPSSPVPEGVGLRVEPESPLMMSRKRPTSLLTAQDVQLGYVLCSPRRCCS